MSRPVNLPSIFPIHSWMIENLVSWGWLITISFFFLILQRGDEWKKTQSFVFQNVSPAEPMDKKRMKVIDYDNISSSFHTVSKIWPLFKPSEHHIEIKGNSVLLALTVPTPHRRCTDVTMVTQPKTATEGNQRFHNVNALCSCSVRMFDEWAACCQETGAIFFFTTWGETKQC